MLRYHEFEKLYPRLLNVCDKDKISTPFASVFPETFNPPSKRYTLLTKCVGFEDGWPVGEPVGVKEIVGLNDG